MNEIALPTQEQARALTERIKVAVEGTWILIQEAYSSRAWAALGYETWDAYCTAEFATARLRLPREERQEVVASLRENGLSTRSIAAATGMDQKTVRNDLAASGEEFSSPVVGADGKTYAGKRPAAPKTKVVAAQRVAALVMQRAGYNEHQLNDRFGDLTPATPADVTSELLDAAAAHLNELGFTYYGIGQAVVKLRSGLAPQPRHSPAAEPDLLAGDDWVQPDGPGFEAAVTPPAKPKRRPLPEAFTDAGRDLQRAAERLARLTEDDRFPRNRENTHHQVPELLGALDHTARLLAAMNLPATEASEEARRWWATSLHTISDALTGIAHSLTKEQ